MDTIRDTRFKTKPEIVTALKRTVDYSELRKETHTSEFVESIGRNRRSYIHDFFRQEILMTATEKVVPIKRVSKETISSTTPTMPA